MGILDGELTWFFTSCLYLLNSGLSENTVPKLSWLRSSWTSDNPMISQAKFPSKLLRFQYISLWMLVICNICIHDYLLIASRVIVKTTVWISLSGKAMKDLLLMGNIPLGTIFWFWYKKRILVALTHHLNIICLMVHIPMIFLFITQITLFEA